MTDNTNAPINIQNIDKFEEKYSTDAKVEHAALYDKNGVLIVARTGDYDHTSFTDDELKKARKGTISHTHPHGRPPSSFDINLALENAMTLRAVGVTPDTNETFLYVIHAPKINKKVADAIFSVFDGVVKKTQLQVHKENPKFSAELVERESRNVVIKYLADKTGAFDYRRYRLGGLVSEFDTSKSLSHREQQIRLLKQAKSDADDLFNKFISFIQTILIHNTDKLGNIPVSSLNQIKQKIGNEYVKLILGSQTKDGYLAPFVANHNTVVARSQYAQLLWQYITEATKLGVNEQSEIAKRILSKEDIEAIKKNPPPELDAGRLLRNYQYPLSWLDPNNKKLSDRMWVVAGEGRRKLDRYLDNAITRRSPDEINTPAAEDEELKTSVDAPINAAVIAKGISDLGLFYEATRLLVNEVYRSSIQSSHSVADVSPIVGEYNVRTSPSHVNEDECDTEENNSPYGIDDVEHLPPFHTNCMCAVEYSATSGAGGFTQDQQDWLWFILFGASRIVSELLSPKV